MNTKKWAIGGITIIEGINLATANVDGAILSGVIGAICALAGVSYAKNRAPQYMAEKRWEKGREK